VGRAPAGGRSNKIGRAGETIKMDELLQLNEFLERYSERGPVELRVAAAIDAIAAASVSLSRLISRGALAGITGEEQDRNADGDIAKDLDVQADRMIRQHLKFVPIAALASEEEMRPEICDPNASICVAIDPLDGSSNITANMSVGTIFSIVSAPADIDSTFSRDGSHQLAAGFVVYGPQTSLVLATGDSVDIYTLDPSDEVYRRTRVRATVPAAASEYAVNASNYRHWEAPVRTYIDLCTAGADGAGDKDFNMRWIGSLVAEAYRILTRGGIFLYPADAREGYGEGRLRLVYEAHPMAFIMEQAGGAASTGHGRILDVVPRSLHQRVPLIMGSLNEVREVERLHAEAGVRDGLSAPLFAKRGLFRV
jgi:fructose-1,6-bisphosphatase I